MIALFWMIGLRDVCRTSQGLYNPKGQVEVELEKIRSISGLACPVTRDVSLGAGNAHEQEGSPFPVDYLTVPFQGDWSRAVGQIPEESPFACCLPCVPSLTAYLHLVRSASKTSSSNEITPMGRLVNPSVHMYFLRGLTKGMGEFPWWQEAALSVSLSLCLNQNGFSCGTLASFSCKMNAVSRGCVLTKQ